MDDIERKHCLFYGGRFFFANIQNAIRGLLLILGTVILMGAQTVRAESFSANFKDTDIEEFINTVSEKLNRTAIIDPAVREKISVRSYDEVNSQQYYQFFLNVLEVYGFSVVAMDNDLLKIIPARSSKGAAIPLVDSSNPGSGDEVVIRVVSVHNVADKDLAPLLRQLNDNAGVGSVVHYDASNVLLITGRAAVVKRLLAIAQDMDKVSDQTVETVRLAHASAVEVAKLITTLSKEESSNRSPGGMTAKIVADERTNAALVSGEEKARARAVNMVKQLDREQRSQGNTKVITLDHAKASELVEVLTGVGAGLQSQGKEAAPAVALLKNMTIKADEQTNSLVVTAAPDVMNELQQVIAKLDIRRAQVLVEAIVVEIQDADGLNVVSEVPILGDIPGIGALFRSIQQKNLKRNLMLFIRPTIIRNNQSYKAESGRKFDELQDQYPVDEPIKQHVSDELKQLQKPSVSRELFQQVKNDLNRFFVM